MGETPMLRSARSYHYHELRPHLLLHVRPCNVRNDAFAFAFGTGGFVLEVSVRRQPLLAAVEEIVEPLWRHPLGEVRIAPHRDQPAQRLALLDLHTLGARVEPDHRWPPGAG